VNKIKDHYNSIDRSLQQMRVVSKSEADSDEFLDFQGMLSQKIDSESIGYLEGAIKCISLRVGLFTYIRTKMIIKRRWNELQKSTKNEAQEIVDSVIKPLINATIQKAQEKNLDPQLK